MNLNKNNFFFIDEFVQAKHIKSSNEKSEKLIKSGSAQKERFYKLCKDISNEFDKEWELDNSSDKDNEAADKRLENQRKAIIGYKQEVNFYKSKIEEYLKKKGLQEEWFPKWYTDLVSAIFHENWGLAGIAQWKELKDCSSAKIIGDRIYFLINGEAVLQEQTISEERLAQLTRALLLNYPEIRIKQDKYAEVYMVDGERITIFDGLVKQPIIVFRKDIVNFYTFEEQARRKTIDIESINMQKTMVKLGYCVVFVGPVRSAKTTYLQTWQSYEDPNLEGIQVETDAEIPLHKRMPNAPIVQIVADGDDLENILKPILRLDGDYILVSEARDEVALYIAIEAASRGTRRVKSTFHLTDPTDFVYMAADKLTRKFGGELYDTAVMVAKAYNYIFSFEQLKDKSQKRLTGIYEVRYNKEKYSISIHQICKYDYETEDWTYKFDIGDDKREIGYKEDKEAFKIFENELKRLSQLKPMKGDNITIPYFGRGMNFNDKIS